MLVRGRSGQGGEVKLTVSMTVLVARVVVMVVVMVDMVRLLHHLLLQLPLLHGGGRPTVS